MKALERFELYTFVAAAVSLPLLLLVGFVPALAGIGVVALSAVTTELIP